MDDGRLPREMSFENIAKELAAIKELLNKRFASIDEQFSSSDKRFSSIDERFSSIDERFSSIDKRFDAVDRQLNAAKIRDEEMHGLLKFSLEAREGLRESMEGRFDEVGRKHDQEIGLLKAVLHHVTGTLPSRDT